MKKYLLFLFALLFFISCEKESTTDLELEKENYEDVFATPRGVKRNVCHNGKIKNVSINALPAHEGHGDAVDWDDDGYFSAENDCGMPVDCDDSDPTQTYHCCPSTFIDNGTLGNALHFESDDGNPINLISDYITVDDDPSLNGMTELTMEALVYIEQYQKWYNIMMKGGYGYGMAINDINFDSANPDFRIRFWEGNGTPGLYEPHSDTSIPTNEWVHIAITVDANQTTFYVNGCAAGTDERNNINSNAGLLYLGRQGFICKCNYFDGKMDEVRIWNVARTDQEIAENMDISLTGTESGLVAYYNFDQGTPGGNNSTETTLLDGTSNGNDGTLINFELTGTLGNWIAR